MKQYNNSFDYSKASPSPSLSVAAQKQTKLKSDFQKNRDKGRGHIGRIVDNGFTPMDHRFK